MEAKDHLAEKDPRELLSTDVLDLISRFVQESRGKYVEYDKQNPDGHYFDCTVYSRELKERLSTLIPNLLYLNVGIMGSTVKLGNAVIPFPSHLYHCALFVPDLGIVIEPQTGVVTYFSRDSQLSAYNYYSKVLDLPRDMIVFMKDTDIGDKSYLRPSL
jgi:hypothetical protein